MNRIFILVITAIFILLSSCGNKKEETINSSKNKDDYFQLAVGNTWKYQENVKSAINNLEWEIIDKKQLYVIFDDDSIKKNEVYIRRDISSSVDGSKLDTTFKGFFKKNDGKLSFVYLDEKLTSDSCLFSNDLDHSWYSPETLSHKLCKFIGNEKIETPAGKFDCLKFEDNAHGFNISYLYKGIGLVKTEYGINKNYSLILQFYSIK